MDEKWLFSTGKIFPTAKKSISCLFPTKYEHFSQADRPGIIFGLNRNFAQTELFEKETIIVSDKMANL